MKRTVTVFVSVLTLVLLAACATPVPTGSLESQANYWQQQGSVAGTGADVSLVSDGNTNTIAFEEDVGGTSYIAVKRWTGTDWVYIGQFLSGSSAAGSDANSPTLALDNTGNPVVAYREDEKIYVQRFNGTSWVNVGTGLGASVAANLPGARSPSLALDSAGNPVVAWQQFSVNPDARIYVQRFNGSSWVNVGTGVLDGSSAGDNDAYFSSLALDSSGNPVIAWFEYAGTFGSSNIYVQRFNGTNWVNVGTGVLSGSGGLPSYPSLALDNVGNPVVAWVRYDGVVQNIYVQRFNGASWVNVGTGVLSGSSAGGSDATDPSLALDNAGNPVVAWYEYDGTSDNIYVQQFNGTSWVNVGTTPLDTALSNDAYDSSLSLVNGSLNVAWQEGSSFTDSLYVKRYITNAWADLGGLLDAQGGQSAVNSSIVRKSNNNPVVAWDEIDSNNNSRNVYVRDWTGTTWINLGGAVDRTITNDAENPSLAMRSDNLPTIAWQEANSVYVRRWNGSIWTSIGSQVETTLSVDAITPSLALDTSNIPVVAYVENGNIRIKKASGTSGTSTWNSPFGTTALDITATNETYRPSLALKTDNNPVVAWYEDAGTSFNIYAKEWNGTAWVALGTTIDKTATRDAKDIVLALRTDNRPVVAWEEAGNIYVKRWTGTSWVSLGSTLDKTAGNEALRPSLDLRTDNNPVVTWQEWNGSSYDVFVKRWTGSSWTLIANTADKNVSRDAERPALVLQSDNNPLIAWDEWDGSSENIYVRRY